MAWTTFHGWASDEGADASRFVAKICQDTLCAPFPPPPPTSPFPVMLAFFLAIMVKQAFFHTFSVKRIASIILHFI